MLLLGENSLKRGQKKSLYFMAWHVLWYTMRKIGNRKMNRANCCSSSRLRCIKWLAKVYIASKAYQVMKLDLQISKPTCMLLCHCINNLSSIPNNFSTCLSHPIILSASISTIGSIFLKSLITTNFQIHLLWYNLYFSLSSL